MEAILLIIGFVIGGTSLWLLLKAKRAATEERLNILDQELKASESQVDVLRQQLAVASQGQATAEARFDESSKALDESKKELNLLRQQLTDVIRDKATLETRLIEANTRLEEERELLEEARQKLTDAFKALASDALQKNNQSFLELAKTAFESSLIQAESNIEKRQQSIDALINPLADALKQYDQHVQEMEQSRQAAYGRLDERLAGLTATQVQLQKETGNLVGALRKPQVRGRWGEITLDKVVEVAGLSEHCDFCRQQTTQTEEGILRPDMIINLPAGRNVVIDAKTPCEAYLDALDALDDLTRNTALKRFVEHVRTHMRSISSKAYWEQFQPSPDFVVMFLPAESFFSAALEQDRELIETGIKNKVILATPTTLIALLRTVAIAWHQEQIIENAERIAEASHELFARICTFAGHLGKIQDGLDKASKAYNDAVSSWQKRVLPQGRRVTELGGARHGHDEIPDLNSIDTSLKELPAHPQQEAEA